MVCNNCGYRSDEEFDFCPNCGKPAKQENAQPQQSFEEAPVQTDFVSQRALSLFKDQLFLVLCILQSVAVGLSLIGKNFNVIGILFTVFLWLIYSQSRKNIADARYMRYISGTNFAVYVLGWVAAGAVALLGVLVTLFLVIFGSSSFVDKLMYELRDIVGSYANLLSIFLYKASIVILIICIIIAAVIAVFTFFGYRSIHKFSQSLYRSVECKDLVIVNRRAAQSWMLVFGILNGISALSSIFSANLLGLLSNGSAAGAYIIAYLLINKYYSDCN